MTESVVTYGGHSIEGMIRTIRGQRVVLDLDLASIYGVPTKRLNEQVRRNIARFPADFVFRLTREEVTDLISQSAISSLQHADDQEDIRNRSQIATGSRMAPVCSRSQIATLKRGQNIKYSPYAFTEHGAIMAATVLNSPRAVQMSVFVVRAFIKMREQLMNRTEMEKRLAEIEKGLLSHDAALRDLYAKIRPLLLPPPDPPKKSIGFQIKERRASYGTRKGK